MAALDFPASPSVNQVYTANNISYTWNGLSWDTSNLASVSTVTGTLAVANGGTGVITSTGTGSTVLSTSPTLVTPALGTPSALVGTNITGTATAFTASNVTTNANLTGVVTSVGNATVIADAALSIAKTSGLQSALDAKQPLDAALTALAAGSDFVQFTGPLTTTKVFTLPDASSTLLIAGGALGTPSSGTATNLTGTAAGLTSGNVTTNANLTGGVISVGNAATVITNANLTGAITSVGNATSLGSFTSAQLASALTDETGTGANVFATSPTLVTPALGTPASGVVTNLTGTASININGTVGATTPATGTFTALAATGLNATVGGFYNAANKFGVDNNVGTSRLYTSGPNTSTRGTYDFRATDSVGTLDTSLGTWSTTGLVVTGSLSATGTVSGSNLSGTNTGDQTNISGNAATATTASNTNSISNVLGVANTFTASQTFTGNGNTATAAGIGLGVFSTASNGAVMAFHRGGVFAINMGLDSDNVIRIGGWSAAANRFQMDMTGNLTMAGNVTAFSDERLKTNWTNLPHDFIERLAKIKSGTYTRIDSGERQAGASAQDWQELLPEVVSATNDEQKTLSLSYGNAALVSSVELAKEIVSLKDRISTLEALVTKLIK